MKFEKFIGRLHQQKKPMLAVLIDPDKFNPELIRLANSCPVSCFLVGGSIIKNSSVKKTVLAIKKISTIPVILFPGDETQLCANADGLFLPSLVSGKNAEYLITKQVKMAPLIKRMKLHSQPMAYTLIDGKHRSSTQKVTQTIPMDSNKAINVVHTAMAAEYLGFKLIYLEAGSGAKTELPTKLIKAVRKQVELPLIVGGGINSTKKTRKIIQSGANMLVIGNALEKNVYLLKEISSCFEKL